MTPAKVNSKAAIHQGRVFQLVRENVTLPNGVTVDMDIVRHPGAAAIVALTEEGSVILIRQYRHAAGGYMWEIPAGTLDPHEAPLACANRELIEESGFKASSWHKLGEVIPVPGYSDERIHLYLACELTASEQDLDQDEVIEVHKIPLQEALEMIYGGKIRDGKSISGLLMAEGWLRNHRQAPRP